MPRTVQRNCQFCQKSFDAPVKELNRGNGRFCSRTCGRHAKRPKPNNSICAYCNLPFYRSPSHKLVSKSGLLFCCRAHKDVSQRIGGIEAIQPGHYGSGEYADYRKLALESSKVCVRCGYDKYVVVHHKDRNRSNNSIENLEVLCPNCHALEHLND